jgi:hypothetical protein
MPKIAMLESKSSLGYFSISLIRGVGGQIKVFL